MKEYLQEVSYYLKHKGYMASLILVSIISYGYAAVNTTISIDDTRAELYVGNGHVMLASGRFGMTFFVKLFGYNNELIYNSFAIDVISVVFFIGATINFCILFRKITRRQMGMVHCAIFSCVMVSYPLMNEIWEYTCANLCICVEFFCVSIVLLLIWEQIHSKWKLGGAIASMLLLMLVCATYESLVGVYIFFVFAVLALQILYGTEKEKELKEVFRQGIVYAGILAGGFLIKVFVSRIILILFHLTKTSVGATKIAWGQTGIVDGIVNLLRSMKFTYITRAIIYMPLTEFVLCMILLFFLMVFLVVKNKNLGLLIPFGGMFLSPFLLSFLQGIPTPLRACQVFTVFVAFTLLLLLIVLEQSRQKWVKILSYTACGGCLLLALHQAVYLNYFLTANHFRWEEEKKVIYNVADDLSRNYDVNKPVIFTGCYDLSDEIIEAVSVPKDSLRWNWYAHEYAEYYQKDFYEVFEYYRKIPSTNIQSVLGWASYTKGAYQDLFEYCGFHCVEPDPDINLEVLEQIAVDDMPKYPKEGYILDMGNYIIVHF